MKSESAIIIANKNKHIGAALKSIVESTGAYNVVCVTDSGKELLGKLKTIKQGILVLDVQLKNDNAYHLVKVISTRYPHIRVIMFTGCTHPYAVKYMLKHNAVAYLSVEADAKLVLKAIHDVCTKGVHYHNLVTKKLHTAVSNGEADIPELSAKQMNFLRYCCTELSYNEIAVKMKVSLRTVDWYRDVMFDTFKLNNRVELVLFALRAGLVEL
jgi:DNA-binding NarL/FixJ family response regulator